MFLSDGLHLSPHPHSLCWPPRQVHNINLKSCMQWFSVQSKSSIIIPQPAVNKVTCIKSVKWSNKMVLNKSVFNSSDPVYTLHVSDNTAAVNGAPPQVVSLCCTMHTNTSELLESGARPKEALSRLPDWCEPDSHLLAFHTIFTCPTANEE